MAAQSGDLALSLRDVPVRTALEELVSRTGISLVYSSELVEGRRTVCRREGAEAEELLRCILEGAELDFYRLSSGTYVVIDGPEALPAYGTISGQIVDGLTGEPVPFATVSLADGSQSSFASATGVFFLPRLLPGPHQLVVSQPGYSALRLPLEVFASGTTRRQIRLDPAVLELDPIVVEGIRNVGGGAVETPWTGEGFADAVPVRGEVSQQVRSGLGVSRRPLFADLSIQGSAPGEHMVRLDGVPVFDPVSLGRSRSAFSPLALRRITVRKAGFGAEHGSYGGGVIDVEHALVDRAAPNGVTTLADPYSVNADVSLPLAVLGGEGSLMAAGRTSIWNLYREPSLDQALRDWNRMDPLLMQQVGFGGPLAVGATEYGDQGFTSNVGFSDIHGVVRLEFPGFRSIQGSFYRGTNDVWTDVLSSAEGTLTQAPPQFYLTREEYRWSNTVAQLRLESLLGDRGSVHLRGWGSYHRLDHNYGLADAPGGVTSESFETVQTDLRTELASSPQSQDGNEILEWGAAIGGDAALGAGHFLSGGVELVRVQSRAELLNGFLRPLVVQDEGWRWSGFLQDRWRVTSALTLEAGLRATSVRNGDTYLEPRLAARVDGSGDVLGPWTLRVSGGVFRQYLNQFSLTNVGPSALVPDVRLWLPSDGSLEPPRTRHLALEAAARPWNNWEVRVEGYYKALDRILDLDYSALVAPIAGVVTRSEQVDFVGVADGFAYGMGGRLGWERGRARIEGAYDWTVSERTFPSRFDGQRQPTPWVEPHRVTLHSRIPVFGGFAVEAESRTVWGRTWGLRRAYYDFLTLHDRSADALPIGLPGDDPLPTLNQLDVGVSWLGQVLGALTELRAEVRNAQGERQVLDYSLVRYQGEGTDEDTWRRWPRLLPGAALLLSARIGF